MPASRWRKLAPKLWLAAVASGLSLVALEYAVRFLLPFYSPASQVPFQATQEGVALGPIGQTIRQATPKGDYDVAVTFNQYGVRDEKDLLSAKPEDWFALGDSFTMGWGVDSSDRFSSRLERTLQESGSATRVFNLAIPNNFIGYQRLLKHAESRGAIVGRLIVGVCMENDLQDYTDRKSDWDRTGDVLMTRKDAVRNWFKRHSSLYIATSFALQRNEFTRRLCIGLGIARGMNELSSRNEWKEAVLQTSRDELLKLVEGRRALVLIIPARRLWDGDNIATEKRVHDEFVKRLGDAGLSVVDVRAELEATGEPLAHYFKTDPHWNSRGHALAARQLSRSINSLPGH